MNQDSIQKVGTTGYATGTICPKTGSYRSSSKYLDTIVLFSKGDKFPTGVDGSKTTWTALSSSDSTKTSFESVKVTAGTV